MGASDLRDLVRRLQARGYSTADHSRCVATAEMAISKRDSSILSIAAEYIERCPEVLFVSEQPESAEPESYSGLFTIRSTKGPVEVMLIEVVARNLIKVRATAKATSAIFCVGAEAIIRDGRGRLAAEWLTRQPEWEQEVDWVP